jgi:hypothetical protein
MQREFTGRKAFSKFLLEFRGAIGNDSLLISKNPVLLYLLRIQQHPVLFLCKALEPIKCASWYSLADWNRNVYWAASPSRLSWKHNDLSVAGSQPIWERTARHFPTADKVDAWVDRAIGINPATVACAVWARLARMDFEPADMNLQPAVATGSAGLAGTYRGFRQDA